MAQILNFFLNEYKTADGEIVAATCYTDIPGPEVFGRRIHFSGNDKSAAIDGLCKRLDEMEVDYEIGQVGHSYKKSGEPPPEGTDGD